MLVQPPVIVSLMIRVIFFLLRKDFNMSDLKTGPAKAPARVTDALTKWEAEAAQTPTSIAEIRLDGNERLVVPFTKSIVEAHVHYLDYHSLTGYVHCNGNGCLLCQIGRHPDIRDLLPVYDPVAQTVGVLAVSPNMRPQALKPQLMPVLRLLQQGQRVLIGIKKLDKWRYTVTILPLPAGAEDGAAEINKFLQGFQADAIDPRGIYPQMDNEALASITEVANQLRLRGIML